MGLGESSDEWRREVGQWGKEWPGWASCQAQAQSIHIQPVAIRSEVSMHSPLGLYFFFLAVLGIELRTCY